MTSIFRRTPCHFARRVEAGFPSLIPRVLLSVQSLVVGVVAYSPGRPLRWNMSTHRAEMYDVKAGAELLDIILTREGHGADPFTSQVASSPPFFCGSPPTRVGNPLIQDARFGEEERTPPSPISIPSPSTTTLKGGCARMKVGHKAAAVRVEGFDCLNRDHQNSSIRAMA